MNPMKCREVNQIAKRRSQQNPLCLRQILPWQLMALKVQAWHFEAIVADLEGHKEMELFLKTEYMENVE